MLQQIDKLDYIISRMAKEIVLDFHRNPQMSMDVPRRKTTFIIREDLLKKAEELGLLGRNLSVFVEKFLEKFLPLYEQFTEKLEGTMWGLDDRLTPGVGFEPTTPEGSGLAGRRLTTRQPRLSIISYIPTFKTFDTHTENFKYVFC